MIKKADTIFSHYFSIWVFEDFGKTNRWWEVQFVTTNDSKNEVNQRNVGQRWIICIENDEWTKGKEK